MTTLKLILIAAVVACALIPALADASRPNGQKGYEGQPGNHGNNGSQGYEGQPGNQGG